MPTDRDTARSTLDELQQLLYHRGYLSGEHWDWMHDTVVTGWLEVLEDMQMWFLHRAEPSGSTSGVDGDLAEVE